VGQLVGKNLPTRRPIIKLWLQLKIDKIFFQVFAQDFGFELAYGYDLGFELAQ
jgi:hypothetical protein